MCPKQLLFIVTFLLLGQAASVAAQSYDLSRYADNPPGRLATPVSIRGTDVPVSTLIRSVGGQSGLSISFDTDVVDALPRRTVDLRGVPAARALLVVLEGSELSATVSSDWRIVIARSDSPGTTTRQKTQTIRGSVVDRQTRTPLTGATVVVVGSDPLIGATTNADGRFVLGGVPLGRHDVEVRYLGYDTVRETGVLLGSAKEAVLDFETSETVLTGDGVVVRPTIEKDRPVNDMAAVSARGFTVEETRRYAGGVDDPARMASAFAGITTTGDIGDNALIIRGNAPKGVLWRLEGVEIPNPNHFAGLTIAGGGGVTLFSGQMLDDSDFMTGAFAAEYGNALAGVFDMHLRRGNPTRREHTAQIGVLGIDLASEGPLGASGASYLFNYRYSTLGLLMPLLPVDDLITYQDLSFKLSIPTRHGGRLEWWGIGGYDRQRNDELEDTSDWQYVEDRIRLRLSLGVAATGLTYRHVLGTGAWLSATAAATSHLTEVDEWMARFEDGGVDRSLSIRNLSSRAIAGVTLNHKFSSRAVNRTGFEIQGLAYDLDVAATPPGEDELLQTVLEDDRSAIIRVFSQTRFEPARGLTVDAGLHAMHFALTRETALEPRAAVRIQISDRHTLSAGYGLHSQVEDLRIYVARSTAGDRVPNRDLALTKAQHGVLGYDVRIGDVSRVRVEAYYQHLFDVPVIRDSTYSLLNFEQDFGFAEALTNDGAGRNYGVELTVERFLDNGYYFLLTGSLFKSRYRAGDGVWRDTRYDRIFGANALFGREFVIDRTGNIVGLNGRVTVNGGHRFSPVDQEASAAAEEVIYDEGRIFAERGAARAILDLTATYRRNHRRFASIWALQVKNVLAAGHPYHDYDYTTGRVESLRDRVVLPVLSWKVEF